MSSWEERLQRLFGETPRGISFRTVKHTILNTMEGSSDDRSVALVSTALAETSLILGIAAVLQPRELKAVEALFWAKKAKYPTFYSRIEKAHDLNLIGPQTKRNLNVIRQVRNVFAHAMIDVTFDTPEISEACAQIILAESSQLSVTEESHRQTRFRFCYGCHDVFQVLISWTGYLLFAAMPKRKPDRPLLP
jgi:hypothetical protein